MTNSGEKAMALVDGQLAPTEVPALVQELARNGALVAELQGYLAMSRSRVAQAYAAKADEPVPRRLIDAVMEAPIQAGASRPAAFASPLGGRLVGWLRGSCRVPAWSLAAAPTLAAATAFAVAVAVLPVGRGGTGALASADVGAALERTASGKEAALASVRPMLSFNSKDAGWCRQFEMRSAEEADLLRSGVPRPGRRLAGDRLDGPLLRRRRVRAGWCRSPEGDRRSCDVHDHWRASVS